MPKTVPMVQILTITILELLWVSLLCRTFFLFSAFIYGILNSDAPQQFQLFHSPYGIHFNSFLAFNVQLNRVNQCFKFIVRAH